eukprot:TRINITY_DN1481_c0_g1_i15.p2 TRINITY_DN1481_c0_g1~~TRINITY_DN1481_c0_g1_i15.p2  ORF type:complete len:126 (-),score=24.81 TRINITY_DN1481_c0_g1_i15:549-926(-)
MGTPAYLTPIPMEPQMHMSASLQSLYAELQTLKYEVTGSSGINAEYFFFFFFFFFLLNSVFFLKVLEFSPHQVQQDFDSPPNRNPTTQKDREASRRARAIELHRTRRLELSNSAIEFNPLLVVSQ